MAMFLPATFIFCLLIPFTVSQDISAIFAFGDSTIDAGNNDYITTWLRSNHVPYGRDLTEVPVPTGRFSNGKLITDFLVSALGLKSLLPAYLDPMITDLDLLTGVSFASAGSGFDDRTTTTDNVIKMSKQIQYFEECVERIRRVRGAVEAIRVVNDAVFVISAGTNDMLWNFYDLPTREVEFTVSGYHDFLLNNLIDLVQKIYKMGGRKITIAGLPPVGCLPLQMFAGDIVSNTSKLRRPICINGQNEDAKAYNIKLQGLITSMQASHSDSKILYVDIFNPLMDMIQNPKKYGFEDTTRGCCGTGLVEMAAMCNSLSVTCRNASNFLFWDAIHPTQSAYQALAFHALETVFPLLE
ncbi:GDSL esterase/lipase At2g40250-like [Magnolia sinica]|uniref:GDSL esterase/lipase At2g40250-like n=1 Tax=Magnolia sinica TaxID=86752 RepID=UPI0026596913|nr:GDSL esterase/lipase At2g40250-like [Magnolia sinica]